MQIFPTDELNSYCCINTSFVLWKLIKLLLCCVSIITEAEDINLSAIYVRATCWKLLFINNINHLKPNSILAIASEVDGHKQMEIFRYSVFPNHIRYIIPPSPYRGAGWATGYRVKSVVASGGVLVSHV